MSAPDMTSATSAYAHLSQFMPSLDFGEHLAEMEKRAKGLKNGDLSLTEEFLISQATALDAIFNNLAFKAVAYQGINKESSIKAMDLYMRLALKAQSQCRTTLEALAGIKNPRSITVTKQANIANQQVVNNGTLSTGDQADVEPYTHSEKTEKVTNELLDDKADERMDSRAPRATGDTNQTMETMEAFDWRKDQAGES